MTGHGVRIGRARAKNQAVHAAFIGAMRPNPALRAGFARSTQHHPARRPDRSGHAELLPDSACGAVAVAVLPEPARRVGSDPVSTASGYHRALARGVNI